MVSKICILYDIHAFFRSIIKNTTRSKTRSTSRKGTKKGHFRYLSKMPLVIRLGVEPKTYALEGRCSIQLSYQTIFLSGCKDTLK